MYADDTNLTFASNNIDDINYHLNHDLANVNKWHIAKIDVQYRRFESNGKIKIQVVQIDRFGKFC